MLLYREFSVPSHSVEKKIVSKEYERLLYGYANHLPCNTSNWANKLCIIVYIQQLAKHHETPFQCESHRSSNVLSQRGALFSSWESGVTSWRKRVTSMRKSYVFQRYIQYTRKKSKFYGQSPFDFLLRQKFNEFFPRGDHRWTVKTA